MKSKVWSLRFVNDHCSLGRLLFFCLLSFVLSTARAADSLPDVSVMVERQSPSVVAINAVLSQDRVESFSGYGEQPEAIEVLQRAGVGFVFAADGLIITSATLVKDAVRVTVYLSDRREAVAQVLARDEVSDVALLKIQLNDLLPLRLADARKTRLGDGVVQLGFSPVNGQVVAMGLLTGRGAYKSGEGYIAYWLTSLMSNFSDLGAPLVNAQGELVAMNSRAYFAAVEMAHGGLAIPAEVLLSVANQLRQQGRVLRGHSSVAWQELSYDQVKALGVPRVDGVVMAPNSRALVNGLQSSDVVVAVNGMLVKRVPELLAQFALYPPGEKVVLDVLQKSGLKKLAFELVVASEPVVPTVAERDRSLAVKKLGIAVKALSRDQLTALNIRSGLLISQVEGKAAREAGLLRGDVLLAIGNQAVSSVEQLEVVLQQIGGARRLALLVQRGGSSSFFALKLP